MISPLTARLTRSSSSSSPRRPPTKPSFSAACSQRSAKSVLVEGEAQLAVFEDEVLARVVVFASRGFHESRAPGAVRRRGSSGSYGCVPARRPAVHGILHGSCAGSADAARAVLARGPPLYAPRMARLTQHGLRRVLGTSALFSTAYGNVGSSIYYALGLVASYALGLTPIVFLITGVIFYLTAATYAEATAMYPRGGRLVELRAPRLQRAVVVLRGLGADAQLHDHDRDLGVLRAALPRRAVLAGARARPGRRAVRRSAS